jgi:hypothetical protein
MTTEPILLDVPGALKTWVPIVLGALVAFAGLVKFVRDWRHERRQDDVEARRRADRVTAFAGLEEDPDLIAQNPAYPNVPYGRGSAAYRRWVVSVTNGSDQPIYNCFVVVGAPHGPLRVNVLSFGTVGAGVTSAFPQQHANVQVPGNVISGLGLRLLLTDTHGRHWQRRDDGQLSRLTTRPNEIAEAEFEQYLRADGAE